MHVAEPKTHLIRYYGEYSVAVQAKRRRDEQPLEHGRKPGNDEESVGEEGTSRAERRARRRAWAQLIRRIYERAAGGLIHCCVSAAPR